MTANWPAESPVTTDARSEQVDDHQVVHVRVEVPDDARVSQIRSRPVSSDEFVVELRLRRGHIGADPRAGVPVSLIDNFTGGGTVTG